MDFKVLEGWAEIWALAEVLTLAFWGAAFFRVQHQKRGCGSGREAPGLWGRRVCAGLVRRGARTRGLALPAVSGAFEVRAQKRPALFPGRVELFLIFFVPPFFFPGACV